MDSEKEKRDLDKLGTVLAMCNDTNRRSLDLLERQQQRQVRMVWASLTVVIISFLIVGLGMYLTYNAVEGLTTIVKEVHYDKLTQAGQEPSYNGYEE